MGVGQSSGRECGHITQMLGPHGAQCHIPGAVCYGVCVYCLGLGNCSAYWVIVGRNEAQSAGRGVGTGVSWRECWLGDVCSGLLGSACALPPRKGSLGTEWGAGVYEAAALPAHALLE